CSLLLSLRVYVAFRAPIGVSLCNLDRFLLLRGWVPALNLLLVAFLPGVALPLMEQGRYGALFFLAVLVAVTVPFTKIFVKLSHHCQRGTANTTCHLFMDAGLLMGLAVCCLLSDGSSSQFDFDLDCHFIYKIIGIIASVSLLFYFLLTYPYYKRKRVR
ncbi:MAG: MFS transporter, partial [Bacteroides sp.]|nr:MFS transporter [Bacteroides sp.]